MLNADIPIKIFLNERIHFFYIGFGHLNVFLPFFQHTFPICKLSILFQNMNFGTSLMVFRPCLLHPIIWVDLFACASKQ